VLLWERGNAATDNGGRPLEAQEYCRIKYTTDSVLWQEWGPYPIIDKANPPTKAAQGDSHREQSYNKTLNRLLGID
jgi:hypothetical protein